MGDTTAIGWTHRPGTKGRTWNCVRGCSRVSEGCRHCYAEQQAARIVRMGKGKPTPYDGLVRILGGEPRWTGEVRLIPERLEDPLRWKSPSTVFVNSMSDLFHESLTHEQIAAVFGVMAACPQHVFQVLTKRARRMKEWFSWAGTEDLDSLRSYAQRALDPVITMRYVDRGSTWPLPNVWIGVSVENQEAADERIPDLLETPASVRFLSCEPLLGPLDLTLRGSRIAGWDEDWKYDTLRGAEWANPHSDVEDGSSTKLDWVIDGCESGPGARPAEEPWFRSLAEQCREAGVPYFHKQMMVNGKLRHDPADFPPGLQIQEWPK